MSSMRRTLVPRRREDGVSLIMVLVTLVVFGLLVPVLGQFGSVNGISAFVVKDQRFDRYAADSGMQGAIAWAQAQRTAGRVFTPCPEVETGVLPGASSTFDRSAHVKCQGFRGSGATQATPSMPEFAVLGFGGSNEQGIEVNGGGTLHTRGAWWSDSGTPGSGEAIRVDGPKLDAATDLIGGAGRCRASGGGSIVAAPLRCDTGELQGDPNYTSAVGSISDVPIQFLPDDPCDAVDSNGVVELAPGFYWDREGLNDLTTGDCGPVLVHLRAGGFYYFDFNFYRTGASSSESRWSVGGSSDRALIVGGEPAGWNAGDPNALTNAWNAVASGNHDTAGACEDGTGPNVVFGGESQLRIRDLGRVELCSPADSGGAQRISIYGQKTGDPAPPVAVSSTPTAATPVVENGSPSTFTWPASLPSPAALATKECSGTSCNPANFVGGTLTGDERRARIEMRLPNMVPPGGRVESVRLVVDHREDDPNGSLKELTVELREGNSVFDCNNDLAGDLPADGAWREKPFDCPGTIQHPLPQNLADLSVVFRMELEDEKPNEPEPEATFQVDQVAIEALVTAPVLRRQDGCVITTACRFLYLDNTTGGDARLAVRGTVYSPLSRVRLGLNGVASGWLTRGVVTKNLQIDDPPTAADYFPVSLPGGGSYSDRLVTFVAYLGPGDANPFLTARVRFCDFQPEGGEPAPECNGQEGQAPRVISWEPKR